MIRLMAMAYITTLMVLPTKATGKTTSSMVEVKRPGTTEVFMMVSILPARSMDRVSTNGTMVASILVSGLKIKSRASELTLGSMVASTKASG